MSYIDNIKVMIEEEVENRVNERMNSILEHISIRWDISLSQLMRDLPSTYSHSNQCLGVHKKSNKRCKNRPQKNGYCHMHQSQMPKKTQISSPKTHTHTLPPFYMKGCPVCERTNRFRELNDCFDNE